MDVSPNAIAKALRLRKRFRGIECGKLSALIFQPSPVFTSCQVSLPRLVSLLSVRKT